ncbi:MAG: hypothetical protein SZ59_C0005G0006 [candidate division TM6 bacterium GW2011_GWF2_28_16]|nr:MAG: hypothetical protein SZ59_C0005G0006 [candidate division TM6 bacterium GW2011_GWF2_28_16]
MKKILNILAITLLLSNSQNANAWTWGGVWDKTKEVTAKTATAVTSIGTTAAITMSGKTASILLDLKKGALLESYENSTKTGDTMNEIFKSLENTITEQSMEYAKQNKFLIGTIALIAALNFKNILKVGKFAWNHKIITLLTILTSYITINANKDVIINDFSDFFTKYMITYCRKNDC